MLRLGILNPMSQRPFNYRGLGLQLASLASVLAGMFAANANVSYWWLLLCTLAVGIFIWTAVWLVLHHMAPSHRAYGYLGLLSFAVFFLFVLLPYWSGGLLIEGVVSWAVLSLLCAGLLHYYRRNALL